MLKETAERIRLLVVSRVTILNVRVNTAICHTGRKNAPDSVLLNCTGGKSVTGKERLHKVGIVSQCGKHLDTKLVSYVWKPEKRHRKSFGKFFRHIRSKKPKSLQAQKGSRLWEYTSRREVLGTKSHKDAFCISVNYRGHMKLFALVPT